MSAEPSHTEEKREAEETGQTEERRPTTQQGIQGKQSRAERLVAEGSQGKQSRAERLVAEGNQSRAEPERSRAEQSAL